MKKLLFVSKDIGGANVATPLIKLAQKSGYGVEIVAEGLAVSKYEESGLKPYFRGVAYPSQATFNLDIKSIIKGLKPSVIVTTLGAPINLEQSFGLEANNLGIPLVFLEDYWGAHVRSKAVPDLVLSIDELAAELARSRLKSTTKVVIVGNYAVNNVLNLEIPDGIRRKVEDLRNKFGRVLVFTAGGSPVSGQISLLAKCLKMTSNWVLIPRFHPKSANLIGLSGKTFGEEWQELLEEFGDRIVYIESKTSEPIVALADATLSGYSTLLTTALTLGHPAVSIVSSGVRDTMKDETGFTSHPLVKVGLVRELVEPCNLNNYLDKPNPDLILRNLNPYDPEKALIAIENLGP